MTRYADPERCPECRGAMPSGAPSCPHCELPLDGPLAAELFTTLLTADDLLARMRQRRPVPAAMAATAPSPTAGMPLETSEPWETPVATQPWPAHQPRPARRHTLSGASVPKILLGLGALCLLVAALVFLVVSWTTLGVAGRTAALVGFTVIAAGLSAWAARHDLRAGAESLSVVALGLLSFDLVGAQDAGWLGEPTISQFMLLLGVVLAVTGALAAVLVRRTPAGKLLGAEIVAGLGVAAVSASLPESSSWLSWSAATAVAVVVAAGAAYLARRLRLDVLAAGGLALALLMWALLLSSSVDRAFLHANLGELWLDLEVWPLLVAAALAAVPSVVPAMPHPVRVTAVGVAEVVLALALLAPVTDESITAATVAVAAALVAACAVLWLTPMRWAPGTAAAVGLGAIWMGVATAVLAVSALERTTDAGTAAPPGAVGDRLPTRLVDSFVLDSWLLPLVAVLTAGSVLLLAHALHWVNRLTAPLAEPPVIAAGVVATVVGTVALYPVPVWLLLVLLLAAGAGFTVWSLRLQSPVALAVAVGFSVLALMVSLHADVLAVAGTTVTLACAAAVHLRWRGLEIATLSGVAASASLATAVWKLGAVAEADEVWSALAGVLVLAMATLALPYVDAAVRTNEPAGTARAGTEGGALAAALVLTGAGSSAAGDPTWSVWLAVYLTAIGVAVSALALLRPDRRKAGWLGGLFLAAASWVRLWDVGVDDPEAYTLPSAIALLVVGVLALRRNRTTSTMDALSPGLGLALAPSLIWVLVDPVALRSVLLGVACLGLVVGGLRLRWSAPVLYGAVVGAVLVLRHATPVAEAVPRWALIATAGALLIAMGITWERRVHDARMVAGYVRALR